MPRNNEETLTKRPKYVRPEKTKRAPVVGPIPADDWQALFFETDDESGTVDEDTVSVVRVACWASVGGHIVGLIPTPEGLVPADEEHFFRGYVDARVKNSVPNAIDSWDDENGEVEEDSE